ncbi:hypothetical protein Btru_025239 [Bulinus truncatus]|nr:hypothetical protein Btru_025239 [Bulinus truncatus]
MSNSTDNIEHAASVTEITGNAVTHTATDRLRPFLVRNLCVGVLGLAGNFLAIVFVLLSRNINHSVKFTLVILSLTAVQYSSAVLAFGNPRMVWGSGAPNCWAVAYVVLTAVGASQIITFLLAAHNFIAVYFPLRRNGIVTKGRSIAAGLAGWGAGHFLALACLRTELPDGLVCLIPILLSSDAAISFSAVCFLFLALTISANVMILVKLRQRRRVGSNPASRGRVRALDLQRKSGSKRARSVRNKNVRFTGKSSRGDCRWRHGVEERFQGDNPGCYVIQGIHSCHVNGHCQVKDNCQMKENCHMRDNCQVNDHCQVNDNCQGNVHCQIHDNGQVNDDSPMRDNSAIESDRNPTVGVKGLRNQPTVSACDVSTSEKNKGLNYKCISQASSSKNHKESNQRSEVFAPAAGSAKKVNLPLTNRITSQVNPLPIPQADVASEPCSAQNPSPPPLTLRTTNRLVSTSNTLIILTLWSSVASFPLIGYCGSHAVLRTDARRILSGTFGIVVSSTIGLYSLVDEKEVVRGGRNQFKTTKERGFEMTQLAAPNLDEK